MSGIDLKAKNLSIENDLDVEVNQAYIDIYGEEYATASNVEDSYMGRFDNDEDFARDQAGSIESHWPYSCIDWSQAIGELMSDYSELDGHYFRD